MTGGLGGGGGGIICCDIVGAKGCGGACAELVG
jgi:hypothetical protein